MVAGDGQDPKERERAGGRDAAFGAGAVGAVVGGMAVHEGIAGQPAQAGEVDGDPGFGSGAAPGTEEDVDVDGVAIAQTGALGRDASFDLVEDQAWAMGDLDDLDGLDTAPESMLGGPDDLDLDDPAGLDLDDEFDDLDEG